MPFFEIHRWDREWMPAHPTGFWRKSFLSKPSWIVEAVSRSIVESVFPETDDGGGFLITAVSVLPLSEALTDWLCKKKS
jgi:hypothetical protein